jgi:hypothetical protein
MGIRETVAPSPVPTVGRGGGGDGGGCGVGGGSGARRMSGPVPMAASPAFSSA